LVYCIHTAEDIVKLLSRSGSPIILVFWPPTPVPNFKGTPSAGAQNTRTRGWEKLAIFDWNRHLSRKRYEIYAHGCYGTSIGSHMRSIEWWHFQWRWRTPNPVFKVTAYLKSNISKTWGQSYYITLNTTEWWHLKWPSRTLNTVFKITAFLKSNILKLCVLKTKLL